jgi:hypothetical protein
MVAVLQFLSQHPSGQRFLNNYPLLASFEARRRKRDYLLADHKKFALAKPFCARIQLGILPEWTGDGRLGYLGWGATATKSDYPISPVNVPNSGRSEGGWA